jgi:hypothetical protein
MMVDYGKEISNPNNDADRSQLYGIELNKSRCKEIQHWLLLVLYDDVDK